MQDHCIITNNGFGHRKHGHTYADNNILPQTRKRKQKLTHVNKDTNPHTNMPTYIDTDTYNINALFST